MKLSIITINLNNKQGLEKTISSVISQTFKDFEYIIIDGGSTDGSLDIISQNENKIAYWRSEPDKGIYNAMNKGILRAGGEYCLFLNSGDVLIKEDILEIVFSENYNEDILFGKLKGQEDYPEKLRFSFMYGWSLPHPASFIKRELFQKISLYDEENKITSDWTFFMKALYIYQCTYRYIPLQISEFDEFGISSQSSYHVIISEERHKFLNTYFPLFLDDYEELYRKRTELSLIKNSRIFKAFEFFRKMLGKKI